MYKCKICNKEFEFKKEFHYISRDADGEGDWGEEEEVKIFDTFDCPHCGCQNVIQERKRVDKSAIVGLPIEEDFKRVENMTQTQEEREELKEQDCFGYYQEYIDKCRKCSEKERCKLNEKLISLSDDNLSDDNNEEE